MEFLHFLEKEGFISEDEKCLVDNIRTSSMLFGVLAMKDDMISPDQLEKVIMEQYKGNRKRVGEILVDEGIMTGEEVEKILAKQKDGNSSYDAILIDLEILTENKLTKAREKYCKFLNKKKN